MKKFFSYVLECIRNISFYKDTIINEGIGGAFKYLIGLVLLLSLIFTIGLTFQMRAGLNEAYDDFYKEVDPNFYVKMENGILSTNVKQPYVAYNKNFALIIDATGIPHELPEFREGVLIKKWSLLFKHEGEAYNINYKETEIDDFSMNKEEAFGFLRIIKRLALLVIPIFMFSGAVFVGFAGKIIYIAFFSLIVWIIGALMKVSVISYPKSFVLTTFALTAPVLIREVLDMLPFVVPGLWLMYYIAFFTYIVLALRAIKKAEA